MNDRFFNEDMKLPDDLKALDEELASIRYEERPSFEPELRAELARVWAEGPVSRPSALRRHLAAAVLAGLLVGGASVPSARASFVRFIAELAAEPVVEVEAVAAEAVVQDPVPEPIAPAMPPGEAPVELIATPDPAAVALPEILTETTLIAPEILDRVRTQHLLQDAYPLALQQQGVGGTVYLRLWIDENGAPAFPNVSWSSGVRGLDRAAVAVAPRFTFAPALQGGRPMGTWIEFPVVFQPDETVQEPVLAPAVDPLSLPAVAGTDAWKFREPLDLGALPAMSAESTVEREGRLAAEQTLLEGFVDVSFVDDFGPLSAILSGEAPAGAAPTGWREAVGSALENAIDVGHENPASMLALARIRLRQGLRTEARSLFERGLQIAVLDADTNPWLVAELHNERAKLIRDRWFAVDGVGRVRAEAFSSSRCDQARSSGQAGSGFASVERLIAWNYLCPGELAAVFEEGFDVVRPRSSGDLTLMMASLRAAIEAYPGHIRANTDLLVTLASEGRWDDVLAGARGFTRASEGHPYGLLLAGLALQRLDRSGEAAALFEAALDRLPDAEADALIDIGFLLDRSETTRYRRLPAAERSAWDDEFWATKDRSSATVVNEPWVEHLARATFAHLRFGSVFGDAGEVWVRFGGPNAIHIVDEGSGRLTEFWDYGSGPDITFVRWVSSNRTDLTPEGRAYVDDLGKIFPPQ